MQIKSVYLLKSKKKQTLINTYKISVVSWPKFDKYSQSIKGHQVSQKNIYNVDSIVVLSGFVDLNYNNFVTTILDSDIISLTVKCISNQFIFIKIFALI